jgi:TM2 domain-containing membrane protein YozV
MKKIFIVILFIAAMVAGKQASASVYSIDEQVVDQLFDNATETSMLSMNATELGMTSSSTLSTYAGEKDALVAVLLDFFLGEFGIHRFYLGTEPISGIAYILTCGGFCGIVPLIDFIILLVNFDDISAYVNNPYFFMWKDEF